MKKILIFFLLLVGFFLVAGYKPVQGTWCDDGTWQPDPILCNYNPGNNCYDPYCQPGSPTNPIDHSAPTWGCEYNPTCIVDSADIWGLACTWHYAYEYCPATDVCCDANGSNQKVCAQSCTTGGCTKGGWYKSCCDGGNPGTCDAIPLIRTCTVGTVTGVGVTACTASPTSTPVPLQ